MRLRRTVLAASASLLLTPGAAQAHLVATGMGPLYDGVSHLFLSPEDILSVSALALYAGLRGPRPSRALLTALPTGWLLAGAVVSVSGCTLSPVVTTMVAALSLLAIGGLLALNPDVPAMGLAGVGFALGATRGAADLSGTPWSEAAAGTLFGIVAGVFTISALGASVTLPLRRRWSIVAVRVAGSWLAATGLLLAGWALRSGARTS